MLPGTLFEKALYRSFATGAVMTEPLFWKGVVLSKVGVPTRLDHNATLRARQRFTVTAARSATGDNNRNYKGQRQGKTTPLEQSAGDRCSKSS